MSFHELPEEGRIGEIEEVCHFLHAHLGVSQLVFDAFHGMLVDDGKGRPTADFFDDGGKMFGRIAKFVSIISNGTVCAVVFTHFFHKITEDVHGAIIA